MATPLRAVLDEAEGSLFADLPRAALALCQVALQRYPRCIRANVVTASALWALGEFDGAIRAVRVILQADPEHLVARYLLATALELEDDHLDDAIAEMEIAFSLSPANPDVREALKRLVHTRDRVAPPPPRAGRDALARTYARAGQWDRVLGECLYLTAVQPSRADLKVLLLEARWRLGQLAEAMVLCQDLLADSPYCLKADLILGDIWLQAGKAEAAEVHFGKALALDPEGSMAAMLFGAAGRPVPFAVDEPWVDLAATDDEEMARDGAGTELGGVPEAVETEADKPAETNGEPTGDGLLMLAAGIPGDGSPEESLPGTDGPACDSASRQVGPCLESGGARGSS
jgi:tetratricopeptide (TPR) repeat protein